MAHFLCHLGCSHFGALLLDFYFTENILRDYGEVKDMWIINLWKDNGTGYNPPILLFIKNNTPEIARNPLLT